MSNSCEASITHQSTTMSSNFEKITLADLGKLDTLGMGAFGRVDLVCIGSDRSLAFAIKMLQKPPPHCQQIRRRYCSEKNIMALASGSHFVVKMLRTFQDAHRLYILMEPCLGGDLYELLSRHGPLSNFDAQFYTACVVEGLEYLHGKMIFHGDLKSSNLMLDSRGYLKIGDLGLSEKLDPGTQISLFNGTPAYMAPEIFLSMGHDFSVDYWTLGVIIFEMLTGEFLFQIDYSGDPTTVCENLLEAVMKIYFPCWMDENVVNLVRELCSRLPHDRIGYRKGKDEIRGHKWFDGFPWGYLKDQSLQPCITPPLKPHGNEVASGYYGGKTCSDANYWPEF